jgi:hypothetical protein
VRVGEGVIGFSVKGAVLPGCVGGAREELRVDVLGLPAIPSALAHQFFRVGQVG